MTNCSISQSNQLTADQVLIIKGGWFVSHGDLNENAITHCLSPHFTPRELNDSVSLLVVHNISLPPGKFGSCHINDFFQGCLNPEDDPYFETIHKMQVSAHCLIRRDGTLVQYVSFLDKAWHAGVSSYKGRDKCNDYSIGIELEGTDDIPYTCEQYNTLALASLALKNEYPDIKDNITGHSDIAPGRKTDPGDSFDWGCFSDTLKQYRHILKG